MIGFMNTEALAETRRRRFVTFFSRTRNTLWTKGETSGNRLQIAAQAAGDYATGSNHVLPTGGTARVRDGLSAADFVRVATVQRLTRQGLARLAPTAIPG